MQQLSELNAISPIDGRYRNKTASLAAYFSEEALIRYRVLVEVEYFIALCELPLPQLENVDTSVFEPLRGLYKNFSSEDALQIKEIEKTTNHDVKAVEYFIKNGFDKLGLTGGLKATVNFESAFDLNVEFLFTQRGSKPDIFNPDFDPDIKIHLDYAEIPVYVSLGDWWQEEDGYHKVSAHAGISFGRLINARTFDYFNPDDQSLDLLVPYFSNTSLSWLAGLSYRMSKNWGLTGRYTRELTPLLSPKKHGPNFPRLVSYYMTFRLEYYF